MESQTQLTLKRAARLLGVHEQTLRSWEKRGIIRMVRLPGSHYRRVPAEEVARLSLEMTQRSVAGGVVVVEPDRSLQAMEMAQKLADAVCTDLADWEDSSSLDAVMAARRGRTWLS